MTRKFVPTFFAAIGFLGLAASASIGTPPSRPAPSFIGKAGVGAYAEVMSAYRTGKLYAPEDFYGAAAILAASKRPQDLILAADLGMIALEKGFSSGARLALDAHRRLMFMLGVRKQDVPASPAPKKFVLAPRFMPSPQVAVAD